ncbi:MULTISPECIES: hypothetical protein [unclassified Sphingomonas]|uniref:hypothetical protein n=1 Tax=unclassified Sphingomonas TaxID=196159 RepID=UPI000E10DD36|nr:MULTISPECIES: hypothetical protein [unclassified Sphingomonas]AXJ95303.1 hypothetical protein DM480_07055 [Sphingomonas sp. FARSPH]
MADKSWGGGDAAPGFRVRSNRAPADRAAERARLRDERSASRDAALAGRLAARAAERAAGAQARETARGDRHAAAEQLAAVDPHAAAARRSRGSGRKDIVREQRDTRGYTTLVDEGRIRELARRGASIGGLAAAFGLDVAAVAAILADATGHSDG